MRLVLNQNTSVVEKAPLYFKTILKSNIFYVLSISVTHCSFFQQPMHKKKNDSILINSNSISNDKIDNTIISTAVDSIDYDIQNNKVFLYNNAEIK